jgi:hypothetical protein
MRLIQVMMAGSAVLTLLTATPSRADLIVNGSFETPVAPPGGFTDFSAANQGLTGWTVLGYDVSILGKNFQQNGITFQAEDGNQSMDLTGVSSNSASDGVSQSVATVVGQQYALSFYVGSATDHNIFFASTVDLSINGGARVSYSNPTAPTNMLNWELFTVDITATSTSTSLAFYDGDNNTNNQNSSLDNVSMVPLSVPEPGSVVLMGVGMGFTALVAVRRRRRGIWPAPR